MNQTAITKGIQEFFQDFLNFGKSIVNGSIFVSQREDHFELIRVMDMVVTIRNLTTGRDFTLPIGERRGKVAYDAKNKVHYWVSGVEIKKGKEFYQMRDMRTFKRCDGTLPKTAFFNHLGGSQ